MHSPRAHLNVLPSMTLSAPVGEVSSMDMVAPAAEPTVAATSMCETPMGRNVHIMVQSPDTACWIVGGCVSSAFRSSAMSSASLSVLEATVSPRSPMRVRSWKLMVAVSGALGEVLLRRHASACRSASSTRSSNSLFSTIDVGTLKPSSFNRAFNSPTVRCFCEALRVPGLGGMATLEALLGLPMSDMEAAKRRCVSLGLRVPCDCRCCCCTSPRLTAAMSSAFSTACAGTATPSSASRPLSSATVGERGFAEVLGEDAGRSSSAAPSLAPGATFNSYGLPRADLPTTPPMCRQPWRSPLRGVASEGGCRRIQVAEAKMA
mmetsp:Transcript_28811/g.83372  ORF Transcript_28811/g.83372 Transcript_28811/m.83372 type:complete len:320 (+) Transcript_28811:1240-2199(+)